MNILIAGRLGFYADRILALKQFGHNLVYCTLLPLTQDPPPFDDLRDPTIPYYILQRENIRSNLLSIIEKHQIDIIYSLKNVWDGSLDILEELLNLHLSVPIVRHYKEHFCHPSTIEKRSLIETTAQIYINQESLDYFSNKYAIPKSTAYILETDYLPRRYMKADFTPKMHTLDGEPHLLIVGNATISGNRHDMRDLCVEMNKRNVHVHLYCEFYDTDSTGRLGYHEATRAGYEKLARLPYIHLHKRIMPHDFTRIWSQYDAGLMHLVTRTPEQVGFEAMNYPNRIVAYLAAGLPLAQHQGEHIAVERLIEREGIGFYFNTYDDLASVLYDWIKLEELTEKAISKRYAFSFEVIAPQLAQILTSARRGG